MKHVIAQHYGLDIYEGDAIQIRLPHISELERDAEWGRTHGWQWLYWPDDTKTIEFPNGNVRLPQRLGPSCA